MNRSLSDLTRLLADLLTELYAADFQESWECEPTANALMGVAVGFHAVGCSFRVTVSVLAALEVKHSHQAIQVILTGLPGLSGPPQK